LSVSKARRPITALVVNTVNLTDCRFLLGHNYRLFVYIEDVHNRFDGTMKTQESGGSACPALPV